jgi:hypothetical protein
MPVAEKKTKHPNVSINPGNYRQGGGINVGKDRHIF